MKVLVVNAGSSTYKCALFDLTKASSGAFVKPLWERTEENSKNTLKRLLDSVWKVSETIDCVGHRVVHGGVKLYKPTLITPAVVKTILSLCSLAPLHNPANLEGIETLGKLLPQTPQVAVFDTAFHHTLSDVAATYPVPYGWFKKDIRRYGFHGISHDYCTERASQILKEKRSRLKIISCHLGNGSSLCAVDKGKSIDTTMGFTPLEGVMMGTRSGSIDPAILLYLLREKKYTAKQLDRILNFESGFKGICGTSDLRKVLEADDPQAKLALEMYVHSLVKNIGAMAAVLEGLDALLFTGGIGENSPLVRKKVCEQLQFLGFALDQKKNQNPKPDSEISTPSSKVRLLVIHTREDFAIAKAVVKVLPKSG